MLHSDRTPEADNRMGMRPRPTGLAAHSLPMPEARPNRVLPPGVNSDTGRLVDDLNELAKADSGQPNHRLIARLKEVLQQPDESRRKLQFHLLVELMRAEDAPLVVETFAALRQKGLVYSEEEHNFFAQRWGELDPQAALRHYASGPEVENDKLMLERVFSGWARQDPAQASHWAQQQPEPLRSEAVFGTSLGWARHDPAGATAFVLALPDGPARDKAGETIFWQVLYNKGMEAAAAWYDQLPPDHAQSIQKRVWPGIAARQSTRDDAGARAWLEQHPPDAEQK